MKPRNLLFISIATILSFALGLQVASEETAKGKTPDSVETDVFFEAAPALIVAPPPGEMRTFTREIVGDKMDGGTFSYVASEMSFGGTPVKGVPYSAEAVTETTQTLADGNRIQRKNSASVYRDSEGRTRREQTLSVIGPWAAAGDPPQTISIHDPVAGLNFVLNPKDKTARKMPKPLFTARLEDGKGTASGRPPHQIEFTDTTVADPAAGIAIREVHRFDQNAPKPETESLGNRVIEGVKAEGSRTTITLPAGQVGNELPISIVSETWFSPELQVVVLSKHNDPRMGETVYKLVNINLSEQPRSLFEVPADFTVNKEAEANRRFQMRKKPEGSGN